MITTILAGLLIFTIVVLVHELGHYFAARKAGILVEEFSIGMGPRLLYFKKGDTIYSLKLFPLGGSCRMLGEDEEAADLRSFGSKPIGWRILVISGGALMNFALAFILSTLLSMFTSYQDTVITDFTEYSPIAQAGGQIGDRIVRINNRNVNIHGDFVLEMHRSDGSAVNLVIERDGQQLSLNVTPYWLEDRFLLGFVPARGVGPFFPAALQAEDGSMIYIDDLPMVTRAGFFESMANGFHNMVFSVRFTVFSIGRLITGALGADQIMGPIGIVSFVGGEVEQSLAAGGASGALWTIANFTALISVNLGIMNLLPLPALDGGRLMFLFLEAIRRKPINPDKEGMVHFAGIILLIGLAIFVAFNDIVRIFST